jgi:hypothetical protein
MSLKDAVERSDIADVKRRVDAGEKVTADLLQLAKEKSEEPEFLNDNKVSDERIFTILRLGPTKKLQGAVTDVMVKRGVPEDVQRHIIEPMAEIGGRRRTKKHKTRKSQKKRLRKSRRSKQ